MAKASTRVRHPILCGTDFTHQAASAATVAAGLAVALRHPLLLVHVRPAGRRRVRDGAGEVTGATGARGVVRIVHVTHPRAIAGGAFETTLGRTDRHRHHVRALSRRLEAVRPSAAQDLGLETEAEVVECEDAVTGICQAAERFDPDVVVVGTKGAGLTKATLRSVAAGVVARMRRPVLVVNPVKD